jgi:hypothetical protein
MKFNKDVFLNEIVEKVQSAIDKNLITQEDVQNNDIERLHGFVQYELLNYIEDRKFAIDVLKDFNFDERKDWRDLQEEYGEFRSLMDIALVNLWKYLETEGATKYSYYEHDAKKTDNMLDLVHDKEDFQDPREGDNQDVTPGENLDQPEISFNALGGNNDSEQYEDRKPKRKIRIAKP